MLPVKLSKLPNNHTAGTKVGVVDMTSRDFSENQNLEF